MPSPSLPSAVRLLTLGVAVATVLGLAGAACSTTDSSDGADGAGPPPRARTVASYGDAEGVLPKPDGAGGNPNIVLVMADDMRVDDLRFAPRIRRLIGRTGITFRNSFSPYSLCCPARASFLTGQYAHNHQVLSHLRPWGFGSFDDSRTLAGSLKSAGYRTGFIGKYLNGYGVQRSRVTGAPSVHYVPAGWDDWRGSLDGGKGVRGGTYNYRDIPLNVNGRIDNSNRGQYSTDVIGDETVGMVRRFSRAAQPFFMYVNHIAPHIGGPRESDDIYRVRDSRGRSYTMPTPARPRWVRGHFNGVINRASGLPKGGGAAEAKMGDKPRSFRRLPEPTAYERMVMRNATRQRAESIYVMDKQIGRLVKQLKRSGEWSDTVLAFTSDNGFFLGEHRRRLGKGQPHEPSVRVPFLLTGPGIARGEKRDDPITTMDVTATILDLADAPAPAPADGSSLVPTLRSGDRGWTRPVVLEGVEGRGSTNRVAGFSDRRTYIGVRTARYSYIVNRSGKDELYDLWTDPRQQDNLVRKAGHRKVRRQLDKVWWDVRDCRAATCQAELPAALQADAAELHRLTRRYWQVIDKTYGFGR